MHRTPLALTGLTLAAALTVPLTACQPKAPEPSLVGGPFQLVDQDGRPVTEAVLNGKWSVVFFGYTFCPDFCPNTLTALKRVETELGSRAKNLQVVFISVDPARDTPAQLKTYVENDAFPRDTLGLTGTPEQVKAVAKAYRVYFQKNGEGEDYLVDHSTVAYLMDPKGRFVRPLAYGTAPAEMAKAIRDAMRQA